MLNAKRLAGIASIVFILAFGSIASAATQVGLGTAGSFVVLAGAGITNTGPTTLNGDIGTYPTTTMTNTGALTITGTNHAGDAVTQQAKTDLVTAYNNAAGQQATGPIVALTLGGGQTLTPGVYNSGSTIQLNGSLTLDGGGNQDAVFIFQAGAALTTASSSSVNLTNGARACNVFWQIGSSATLGTSTSFQGTILALTSITLTTGATIVGRALARNGAVTLDTNTITNSTCAAAPAPTAAPTAAPTFAPTPVPTATPSTPTATPSTPTRTPTSATATPARALTLPSTSTPADLPLGALSVMLIAIGAAVLLIRRTRTSTD